MFCSFSLSWVGSCLSHTCFVQGTARDLDRIYKQNIGLPHLGSFPFRLLPLFLNNCRHHEFCPLPLQAGQTVGFLSSSLVVQQLFTCCWLKSAFRLKKMWKWRINRVHFFLPIAVSSLVSSCFWHLHVAVLKISSPVYSYYPQKGCSNRRYLVITLNKTDRNATQREAREWLQKHDMAKYIIHSHLYLSSKKIFSIHCGQSSSPGTGYHNVDCRYTFHSHRYTLHSHSS